MSSDRSSGLPVSVHRRRRQRGVIRAMLLSGVSSIDAVADRLAINRRTLHRRLQGHGVTFEQLLDATRQDLAQQLLQHSAASMTDIAIALNYANASAFTRSFRRWTGESPSAWRQLKESSAEGRFTGHSGVRLALNSAAHRAVIGASTERSHRHTGGSRTERFRRSRAGP